MALGPRLLAAIPPLKPRDRILSAYASDGLAFTREQGIRLAGPAWGRQEMVYYPHVCAEADGSWSMYYHCSSKHPGGWQSQLCRAVSADGTDWQADGALAMPLGMRHYRAPNRLDWNKATWFFFCAGEDGVQFSPYGAPLEQAKKVGAAKKIDLGLDYSITDIHVTVSGEGGLRAYFSSAEGIGSAHSTDGLRWIHEKGWRLQRGASGMSERLDNPAVVALAEGGYRMYFRGSDQGPIGSQIFSARSADGIGFQVEPGVRLDASGSNERHGVGFPQVVGWNGGWRMYYVGYWGRHWLEPWTVRRWRGVTG